MKNLLAIVTLLAISTFGVGQAAAPKLDSATQAQVSQIVSQEQAVQAQLDALLIKHRGYMAQLRVIEVDVAKRYPGYHLNWQKGILEKNQ